VWPILDCPKWEVWCTWQRFGMQPFSNSPDLLTISCYHKNFMMISQTVRVIALTDIHIGLPTDRHYWKQCYAIAARVITMVTGKLGTCLGLCYKSIKSMQQFSAGWSCCKTNCTDFILSLTGSLTRRGFTSKLDQT